MRWMRGLLCGFADRGGTVLLSSHLLPEVEAVADRIMIISDGQIQAQGTRAELLTESGTIVEADDLAGLVEATRKGKTMAQRADTILSTPPPELSALDADDLHALQRILGIVAARRGDTPQRG